MRVTVPGEGQNSVAEADSLMAATDLDPSTTLQGGISSWNLTRPYQMAFVMYYAIPLRARLGIAMVIIVRGGEQERNLSVLPAS